MSNGLPSISVPKSGAFSILFMVTIFTIAGRTMGNGYNEVASIIVQQSACITNTDRTMECTVTEGTRLPIVPGENSTLLIKSATGEVLNSLIVEVKKVHFVCQAIKEYFTRSFKMMFQSSKRCASAGSCTYDQPCKGINVSSMVSELNGKANKYPGFTYCSESCGCASCGCFLCAPGCLFYRTYAQPITDKVYEVFKCPVWEYRLIVRIHLQKERDHQSIELISGRQMEYKNITIALISVSNPPMPILGSQFMTDGTNTIMVHASASGQPINGTIGQLQCATFEKASKFDCYLPHDSCICHSRKTYVSCHCASPPAIEDLFNHIDYIDDALPIVHERFTISGSGKKLEMKYNHIAFMELQITMAGYRLTKKIANNKCLITNKSFGGCYSCLNGAKLQYVCTTNFGEALAHVTCGAESFSTSCTHNGFSSIATMNFPYAAVKETCSVRCPDGITTFDIEGTLTFIEKNSSIVVVTMGNGYNEVAPIIVQQSACITNTDRTMKCTVTEGTRLPIVPGGNSTLLIKSATGEYLNSLIVQVKKVCLVCKAKNEYFTRSFKMMYQSRKRCASAGSCTYNQPCKGINVSSIVSELNDEANKYPGFTYCSESCGCAACGCLLCAPGCLFYRTYAQPITDKVYEVFTCPVWEYQVIVRIHLQNEREHKTFKLVPGLQIMHKNVTIALISVSNPPVPMPILGSHFMTDGTNTIMVHASASRQPISGTIGQLQCTSLEKAAKFDCYLPHDSCICRNRQNSVSCHCASPTAIEALFNDLSYKDYVLPIEHERFTISGSVVEHDPGRTGVEIIEDPIQSQDSCKVVNVCAPLQLKKEANIYYFPECIDMPQCLGGCCDNSHNCHPLDTQTVRVKVSTWKYDGLINGQQTFSPHDQIMVDIKRHMRCGCEMCINKPECDMDHMLVGCKCICRNHHDSLRCVGDRRYWSDESCTCECSRTWCPNGQVFSTQECKCRNFNDFITLHPKSNISITQTPVIHKANSKLKMASHSRNT